MTTCQRLTVKQKCIWGLVLVGLLTAGQCTFEPIGPPELPTFYQKINLPLTDVALPLANLVDSTNHILGDKVGDSLFFYFAGPLDTVTITRQVFQIPGGVAMSMTQQFGDLSQASAQLNTTVSQTIKMSSVIPIPGVLPSPVDITLDSVARKPLDEEKRTMQVFDRYNIPYFSRVDYLTIGTGTFATEVINQLLVDLEDVRLIFKNLNGDTLAETWYDRVPAGETRHSGIPGNLNGKKLRDSVEVIISAVVAGTHGQPLVIPANTDPFVTMSVTLNLESIESFTGIPKPITIRDGELLPPSKNTIFQAQLAATESDPHDTNYVGLIFDNTLPFDLRLRLTFLNFYRAGEPLVIDTLLNSGMRLDIGRRLDEYLFRNPDDKQVVDSILMQVEVNILPEAGEEVVTIPLDLGGSALGIDFQLGILVFQFIDGFIDETFSIPTMSISNVPLGFTDIEFSSVVLVLHFYNEIRAHTDISLNLVGYRKGFEPKKVSKAGTINPATATLPVAHSILNIDIAEVFNLMPDSMIVDGFAAIPSSDTSHLEVGKSFWGTFEIRVPFQMKVKPMTIIPVTSSPMAPIDPDMRQRIESGLIEASIITHIINDFPLTGGVDILMANYDYFPLSLDSLDSGFVLINDTLFAQTDTGLFPIRFDTLVSLELPPARLDASGRVLYAGSQYQIQTLDTTKMGAILRDEEHFIRPRIHIDGTDCFVQIGYWDNIYITAMLQLTVNGGKFINPEEEEQAGGEQPPLPKARPFDSRPTVTVRGAARSEHAQ
jgi:hypothetical protein